MIPRKKNYEGRSCCSREAAESDLKHVLTEPEKGKEKEGEGGEGIRRAASYMERGEEAVAAVGRRGR